MLPSSWHTLRAGADGTISRTLLGAAPAPSRRTTLPSFWYMLCAVEMGVPASAAAGADSARVGLCRTHISAKLRLISQGTEEGVKGGPSATSATRRALGSVGVQLVSGNLEGKGYLCQGPGLRSKTES